MRFEIVTLFPELFDVLRTGLLGSSPPTDTERSTIPRTAAAAGWC